ncbi:MAG TPA: pitrilysin family protein [Pseudonocardiaceae bacterium]
MTAIDSQQTPRTAAQIGRTELGPRPLPPLGRQRDGRAPAHVDTVLDNGLRVVAVRKPGVPMVELRLRVPFSGSHRTHPARSELMAATLLAGTARRDREAVDIDLARAGADLGASVDPERLVITGNALVSGLPVLLDVLADSLTGAAHRADEVRMEKERLVAHLAMARSQPRTIAHEALQKRRYGNHPITRELPEPQDVEAVTPAAVRSLQRKGVVPRGSVLVLVGDLPPQQAVDALAGALAGWTSDREAVRLPPLPRVTGGDVLLVHRPGAVQSQIRLSAHAVPRTDPRYPALQLANLVFGGYFSARLPENIREDKGFTYGAHSFLEFNTHGAALVIDTDTATDVTAAALWETRHELGRMVVSPPTQEEFEAARRYAVGSLGIALSSQAGLASSVLAIVVAGLDLEWLRGHPARLAAVTRDQVVAAAAEFLAPSAVTGVVVGDADVLSAPMAALGGVEVP